MGLFPLALVFPLPLTKKVESMLSHAFRIIKKHRTFQVASEGAAVLRSTLRLR